MVDWIQKQTFLHPKQGKLPNAQNAKFVLLLEYVADFAPILNFVAVSLF